MSNLFIFFENISSLKIPTLCRGRSLILNLLIREWHSVNNIITASIFSINAYIIKMQYYRYNTGFVFTDKYWEYSKSLAWTNFSIMHIALLLHYSFYLRCKRKSRSCFRLRPSETILCGHSTEHPLTDLNQTWYTVII